MKERKTMPHDNKYWIGTRYGKSVNDVDIVISDEGSDIEIVGKLVEKLLGNKHFESIEIKSL
jgi:hypothetical protein